jgi:hypothetical protein
VYRQAGLDVAQALPVRQLREGHCPTVLRAGQSSHTLIAAIARGVPRTGAPRQKIRQLGKQRFAGIHGRLLGNLPKTAGSSSNRHHAIVPSGIQNHDLMSRLPTLNRTAVE